MDGAAGNALWYKDAVIYELHVKAFFDANNDGIGDFRGLLQKLDYVQDLGITAVWLLPFYPSPFRDDGYDIADYRGVHPDYGSLRDFKEFVREAHRRNIRVITELVVNHTSDQHPWFQAARRARPGSAKRDFYVWSTTDTEFPETRIIFTDSEASNWTWDPVAGAYYWHRFFSHQPDLNHNNLRVVQAVIKVLRFWLDLGVDGFRLDAVPYLCVREGTNNENLEETHAVIRRIRREVDLHYKDRMLLAEANQWPEDVVEYFGKGDECHMAYHFPLMPRIYMALRQEDRKPIAEIFQRTPPIPPACQWGLFLRNHDELTLEMVTDEERDYMYREYATDPRMRVNIGIRRRLAPLLDNSRRRMELLNSLLLSFPGTPILYYGDEIGMGDNVFLGDRNGVRTPMQWSPDRNAGFSRADPARLYLPVIMDPVYGYQGINVEAQQRDPSSLLHFMKRMLALRRQHKAFGRGSLEFLHPTNRKILAYLRRHKAEVLLAVANLSRFVQPAELDLSEFRGFTPVEMIGRTEFPPIGELPYFVTLGPHSFYWFRLERQGRAITTARREGAGLKVFPRLSIDEEWDGRISEPYRLVLEKEILPDYLRARRWFRGKGLEIVRVQLADWTKLAGGFFLAFASVTYADAGSETYCLPLKVAVGAAARDLAAQIPDSILAAFTTPRTEGVIYDALSDRVSCCDLFAAMAEGRAFLTEKAGTLEAFSTRAFTRAGLEEMTCSEVRDMGAEQSNTSLVLDEQVVLKLYRKVEQGMNPDFEVGLFLTEHTDFDAIAAVAGGIRYTAQGRTSAVVMLQPFVPNDGDGWTYSVDQAQQFLRRGANVSEALSAPVGGTPFLEWTAAQPPEALVGALGSYWTAIQNLGRRTGQFHLALSGGKRLSPFAPEPLDERYLEGLVDGFGRQARRALALLSQRLPALPDPLREKADAVLGIADGLMARYDAMSTIKTRAVRIRCHGDYHLGQVLRRGTDWILLDFEGEPLRCLGQRNEKQSPLKDLAGMVRSFSYAAHGALLGLKGADPQDLGPLEIGARIWEFWAVAAFLKAYFATVGDARFVPAQEKHLEALLGAFVLEKAFYELEYEINNRPDWLQIPLDGILTMA